MESKTDKETELAKKKFNIINTKLEKYFIAHGPPKTEIPSTLALVKIPSLHYDPILNPVFNIGDHSRKEILLAGCSVEELSKGPLSVRGLSSHVGHDFTSFGEPVVVNSFHLFKAVLCNESKHYFCQMSEVISKKANIPLILLTPFSFQRSWKALLLDPSSKKITIEYIRDIKPSSSEVDFANYGEYLETWIKNKQNPLQVSLFY